MKHILLTSAFLATLVFAPAARAQESAPTPRDLLERAHYAENHEHDLAAAVDGYRAAAEAARAAGDTNVATEAEAALARVEVRLGARPAPSADLPQDLVDLFVRAQGLEASNPETEAVARDMALYGDAAVQILREWIVLPRGTPTPSNRSTPLYANPLFAAAALGEMNTAAAREALLLALDSSDPLLRRAALQNASVGFGALFARGIDDPVDALRELATHRLLQSEDPSTGAALETLARRDVPGALFRLANLHPLRALAVLEEAWATQEHGDHVTSGISEHARRPMTRETVLGVVRFGWESKSELVRATARRVVAPIRRDSDSYTDQPGDVETMRVPALREALESAPPEMRLDFAHLLDDAAALDAVRSFLRSANGPLDKSTTRTVDYQAGQCLRRAASRGALAEELFDLALPSTDWSLLDAAAAAGDSSPDNTALTAFAWATSTATATLDDAPRIARMFLTIPAAQRRYVCRNLSNWLFEAVDQIDLAAFMPGTLPVAFGEIGVVLLETDVNEYNVAAIYCLRGAGDSRLLELVVGPNAPVNGFRSRELQIVLEDAALSQPQKLSDLLFARIEPHVHAATLPFETVHALDRALGLSAPFATAFLDRLWATKPSQELRHRALTNYCSFQRSDDVLVKLNELYSSLEPFGTGDARPMILRRFGSNLYEPALELLGAALRDRDANVRAGAQDAFEAFRKHREAIEEYEAWRQASDDARETVAQLVTLLASDNRDVVRGAVEALGAVKARTALPQLVALLGRDDAELKAAVNKAIAAIGG